MANTDAVKARFVDGQLTVETKDVTNPNSPIPLTTFTTTTLEYSFDVFGRGFKITFFKDKGSSSSRSIGFFFLDDEDRANISYMETVTTEQGTRPYDYELIDSSSTIERINITPTKHRYAITEFKVLAKSRTSNETREITGRGLLFINDLTPG